jgi:hypothetical protein
MKDLQVNPDRDYNKYLVMRDFLNIYKWRTEAAGYHCDRDSQEHVLLCAIIAVYEQYRTVWLERYRPLAREVLDAVQSLLSQQRLSYTKCEVDFVVLLSLGLSAAVE